MKRAIIPSRLPSRRIRFHPITCCLAIPSSDIIDATPRCLFCLAPLVSIMVRVVLFSRILLVFGFLSVFLVPQLPSKRNTSSSRRGNRVMTITSFQITTDINSCERSLSLLLSVLLLSLHLDLSFFRLILLFLLRLLGLCLAPTLTRRLLPAVSLFPAQPFTPLLGADDRPV